MANEDARCTVCLGELTLFGPRRGYEYHICKSCGTLQLYPMPSEAELEAAYSEQYATAGHTAEFSDPEVLKVVARPYRWAVVRALIDHKLSGLVVDFGAGWGHLCEMLMENGFECQGLKLSSEMASYATKQGLPVHHGGFDLVEAADGRRISAIVMCGVFEHLSHHHAWMRRFNRVLPIGGALVTLHPTAACYTVLATLLRLGNRRKELPEFHGSFAPPWHTAFFTLEAMDGLAKQHGFEVVDIRPVPQGRLGGLIGLAQRCLENTNRVGWWMFGRRWPLITTHVFVLRKTGEEPGNRF